jgi:CRP/FNR family transcriptional regulator
MTDQLKTNPLFSGLDDEGLSRIKEIAGHREIKKGEILFSQGEEAKGFYLVLQGRIKIYRLSSQESHWQKRLFFQEKPIRPQPIPWRTADSIILESPISFA